MPDPTSVLTVERMGRFWVAARGSEDVARSIGWRAEGRFEAYGTPPVDDATLGRFLVRAVRAGIVVRASSGD